MQVAEFPKSFDVLIKALEHNVKFLKETHSKRMMMLKGGSSDGK